MTNQQKNCNKTINNIYDFVKLNNSSMKITYSLGDLPEKQFKSIKYSSTLYSIERFALVWEQYFPDSQVNFSQRVYQ